MKSRILIILFVFCCAFCSAQEGNYFYRNYTPAQAGGSAEQNWGITQDNEGRIYVANLNGIYLHDGKTWEWIQLRNNASCTSVARNTEGVIYVGGLNEFGFLERNTKGSIVYRSISKQLNDPNLDFGTIWKIISIDNKTYFCSNTHIFLYENNKLKTIQDLENGFHSFNKIDNFLLTRIVNTGLFLISGTKLLPLTDTLDLKNTRIYGMVEKDRNNYLLFTREQGVFNLEFNDKNPQLSKFAKIKSNLETWCSEQEIYCVQKINNNEIVIGTKKDGFKVIDFNFNVHSHMNEKSGLQDDGVYSIFKDNANNVWLALANGLCYLETNTPITRWTGVNGVKGSIESVIIFKNEFFIATLKQLQKFNVESGKFESTEIDFPCYDLVANDKTLFIGTDKGVYAYNNGRFSLAYETEGAAVYKITLIKNSNTIFIGTDYELIKGHLQSDKIIVDHIYPNAPSVRTSIINKKGELLFGSANDGMFYLKNLNDTALIHIDISNGLPSLIENKAFLYNDIFMAATDSGFFKITTDGSIKAYEDKNFIHDTKIKFVERAIQIENEIWFMYKLDDENKKPLSFLSTFIPGTNKYNDKQLHRLRDLTVKNFYQKDNLVYLASNVGLFAYDTKLKNNITQFQTLISRIYNHNINDTVFRNLDSTVVKQMPDLIFNYSDNEIYFSASASDYIDKDKLEFSWYLENKESSFNNFSNKTEIHYGNLHEGTYVLHLKSRNIFGIEGNELKVKFTILPPWYRTFWAYIIYFIAFVLVVWLIVYLNTKRLRAKNIQLEEIIHERTKTVFEQKEEIEIKNKEITDSINYAKRIQLSILPDIGEILNNWKDTFIFYQPKDIVSGDFYWYSQINEEEFLIACADCTGHGVPGGFMSMICSDKLHDSLKMTTKVDEILFHTNNAVKNTLKQGSAEGGSKDGMEVGLLKINVKTKTVDFSSASRTLYIIKKDSQHIDEIKPTKASIASFTEYDFKYEAHHFDLKEGDTLYITSDGYPDQFGGKDGKKFMSKNFKNLLLQIVHLPMDEQNKILNSTINEWMRGFEQVDDLLVIGVKL